MNGFAACSLETRMRYGGIFNKDFTKDVLMGVKVMEFWKSVSIWQRCRQQEPSVVGNCDWPADYVHWEQPIQDSASKDYSHELVTNHAPQQTPRL